jgi:hypothetical protein
LPIQRMPKKNAMPTRVEMMKKDNDERTRCP